MSFTSNFLNAIPYVFLHEGGYNNVKNDGGGATNWGISLVLLESLHDDINHDGKVDYLDIQCLTKEQAEDIYFNNFWKPFYDKIPARLADKVFDTAVNMGNLKANILLQKSLNKLGSNIPVDGLLGDVTLAEVSKYNVATILASYCQAQKDYYDAIIKSKPDQIKFKDGWYARASFLPN